MPPTNPGNKMKALNSKPLDCRFPGCPIRGAGIRVGFCQHLRLHGYAPAELSTYSSASNFLTSQGRSALLKPCQIKQHGSGAIMRRTVETAPSFLVPRGGAPSYSPVYPEGR